MNLEALALLATPPSRYGACDEDAGTSSRQIFVAPSLAIGHQSGSFTRLIPCLLLLQEQDDAIRYLDDSPLQGRAIRVEKVPQPPPPAITGASPQAPPQLLTNSSLFQSHYTLLPRLHDVPSPKLLTHAPLPSPMPLYHTKPRGTISSDSCVLQPLRIY